MKNSTFYKFKIFPYAIVRKIPMYQQWNPIRKLSKEQKMLFRSRNNLFSIDSGRPLPKEVFLKIVTNKKQNFTIFKSNNVSKPILNSSNHWQNYCFSIKKSLILRKLLLNNKNPFFSNNLIYFERKAYSLSVFKFVFLRKIWMLYNPSLVPGVARPSKFKKNSLMKIRALKGLHHLTGDFNYKFVRFLLKKSWNMSSVVIPSFWNLPRTVDSLKGTLFLKIGLVFTIPIALALISQKQITVNGFTDTKIQTLIYPGDYLKFHLQNFAILQNIFNISSISKYVKYSKLNLRGSKSRKNYRKFFQQY